MSTVTSPILTDATGQTTNTKLDNINTTLGQIKNVLTTPSDAEDISYDNTSSGMTADNVQEAVDELNASLVNYEDTASSDSIIFDKQGKRRLLTFNRATYSNLQSFVNNLSASDRPKIAAIAPLVRMRSSSSGGYVYGTMGFIYIPNSGNFYIGMYLNYNNNTGYESAPTSNDDLFIGQVEWYVN